MSNRLPNLADQIADENAVPGGLNGTPDFHQDKHDFTVRPTRLAMGAAALAVLAALSVDGCGRKPRDFNDYEPPAGTEDTSAEPVQPSVEPPVEPPAGVTVVFPTFDAPRTR